MRETHCPCTSPTILRGASSSSSTGCAIKISRALLTSEWISSSFSDTCVACSNNKLSNHHLHRALNASAAEGHYLSKTTISHHLLDEYTALKRQIETLYAANNTQSMRARPKFPLPFNISRSFPCASSCFWQKGASWSIFESVSFVAHFRQFVYYSHSNQFTRSHIYGPNFTISWCVHSAFRDIIWLRQYLSRLVPSHLY